MDEEGCRLTSETRDKMDAAFPPMTPAQTVRMLKGEIKSLKGNRKALRKHLPPQEIEQKITRRRLMVEAILNQK